MKIRNATNSVIVVIAAFTLLGCGTVIYTPPEGAYLHLQTILETIYLDTGATRVQVVRASNSGYLYQRYPESYGSVDAFGSTTSDSRGNIYVANAVLNADWKVRWTSLFGGCYGEESN